MCQARKGNQWYLGIKVCSGVAKSSSLIHLAMVMAANVHDFTPAAELLHGDEELIRRHLLPEHCQQA